MQLPSFSFGVFSEVRKEMRQRVRQLEQGAHWQEALAAVSLIETPAQPGLILLDGPNPLFKGERVFHSYLLHTLLEESFFKKRLSPEQKVHIFEQSLGEAWSLLGLVAIRNFMWLYDSQRHDPFLRACRRDWRTFSEVGLRYSNGQTVGESLWSLPSTLRYVLAKKRGDGSTNPLERTATDDDVIAQIDSALA